MSDIICTSDDGREDEGEATGERPLSSAATYSTAPSGDHASSVGRRSPSSGSRRASPPADGITHSDSRCGSSAVP